MDSRLARTTIEGQSIAYRRAGQGPALVLLHGFTLDSRIWAHQLEHLSDQLTVVAWDAPGAGASTDPGEPFSMADWTRLLAGFLDAVGVERAHILGMSWGGVLAQEFYRAYAQRSASLILVATYAGWRGSLPSAVCSERLAAAVRGASLPLEEFVSPWVQGLVSASAPQHVRDELSTIVAGVHPLGFRLMAQTLADTDTTDLLSRIHVPTLLLWGSDDRRSPLSIGEQLREGIPSSEFIVIPNAGHVPNMEQAPAFDAEVRRFLDRL